jgi:hypothetical protein
MNLIISFALFMSGAITVTCILLSEIGFMRKVISKKGAAFFSGIGAGIGCGMFTYFGISNQDIIGSLFTAIISGVVVGISNFVVHGIRR